jgi:cytidine deaminase
MRAEQLTREALMLKLVPVARGLALPPLSNYFVGAVAAGSSGNLYLGANIEIPGNPLGLAVHAEQACIANAYMSDEIGVHAIALSAPPCGHCRQFLSEASIDLTMRVLTTDSTETSLSELLPKPFGPKNLGFTQGFFPVKHAHLSLASDTSDALVREACKAARASYSPYSRSPSGVALLTSAGRVFSGSYIENAAFNPSLPPLQTALAGYFAAGVHAGTIQRAVLVEVEKSGISQQPTTRSALAALAPSTHLETFALK